MYLYLRDLGSAIASPTLWLRVRLIIALVAYRRSACAPWKTNARPAKGRVSISLLHSFTSVRKWVRYGKENDNDPKKSNKQRGVVYRVSKSTIQHNIPGLQNTLSKNHRTPSYNAQRMLHSPSSNRSLRSRPKLHKQSLNLSRIITNLVDPNHFF